MKLNNGEKIKVKEIAERTGIPPEAVKKIIASQYIFIREKITELTFIPDLTREEFEKIKSNFNIPCIGKLYASYYAYSRINERTKNQRLSSVRGNAKEETES